MNIYESELKDLYVIEPSVYKDSRGYFLESYSRKHLSDVGINVNFVQDNISKSTAGVLRGMHYQLNKPQGKLVRCIQGSVLDVAVDIRVDSLNFGRVYSHILSDENKTSLYIPEGFAHGFYVMSDTAVFHYKCTNYYDPHDQQGVLWSSIDYSWPVSDAIVSEKDKILQKLSEKNKDSLPEMK